MLLDLNIGQKNETFSRKLFALFPDKLFKQGGIKSDFTLCEMSTCLCHRIRERLSTYIFDNMIFEVLFCLNCESSKYIAKLFSLSIILSQGNCEQHFEHCNREQHALGNQLTDTKSDFQINTHLRQYATFFDKSRRVFLMPYLWAYCRFTAHSCLVVFECFRMI